MFFHCSFYQILSEQLQSLKNRNRREHTSRHISDIDAYGSGKPIPGSDLYVSVRSKRHRRRKDKQPDADTEDDAKDSPETERRVAGMSAEDTAEEQTVDTTSSQERDRVSDDVISDEKCDGTKSDVRVARDQDKAHVKDDT